MLRLGGVLREHLEDLELEPYSEHDPEVIVDRDWEDKVLRMNEAEKEDELVELDALVAQRRHDVAGNLEELMKRYQKEVDEENRVESPYGGVSEVKKALEVGEQDVKRKKGFGFGLGRREEREAKAAEIKDANVAAYAKTKPAEATSAESKPATKSDMVEEKPRKGAWGSLLGNLQKRLEERDQTQR